MLMVGVACKFSQNFDRSAFKSMLWKWFSNYLCFHVNLYIKLSGLNRVKILLFNIPLNLEY